MSELEEKVKKSIARLKAFEPDDGYFLAFSGGKDSVTCKALLDMAGCKYDATYRVTSVDPPELVRFIKEKHPDVARVAPIYPDDYKNEQLAGKPITMWNLIPEKLMPPTRASRYCCEKLKESSGDGRVTVTGVRWAESVNRKRNQGIVTVMSPDRTTVEELTGSGAFKQTGKRGVILTNDNTDNRRLVETCFRRNRTTVNPIIDWEDSDVWGFIRGNGVQYCELYDEGFHRLGCIGCPLINRKPREREFIRWPKYEGSYMRAFEKMLKERDRRGKETAKWASARDVFNWWMNYDILPGQFNLFEDYEEEDE